MATDDKRLQALQLAHNASDTPDVVVERASTYLEFLDTDPKKIIEDRGNKPDETPTPPIEPTDPTS